MEKSTELRELTMAFYQAMATADMDFIRTYFSQKDGVLVFGTDPAERWHGYEKIVSIYEAQIKEMGNITLTDGDPQAYAEGNVGWAADEANLKLSDDTVVPFRMTIVYMKEAGEWKAVQAHWSVGVPNEQLLGYSLTI